MHILLTAHGFPPHQIGGTQLHTLDMAKALVARHHQVAVFCPGRCEPGEAGTITGETVDGVPVHRLLLPPLPADPDQEAFRRTYRYPLAETGFREIVRRVRPDLVHFHHFFELSASMAMAARDLGLPAVLTLHDLWILCEQPHLLRPDLAYCQDGPADPAVCATCLAGRHPDWRLAGEPETLAGCFRDRLAFLRQAVAALSGVICLAGFQAERLAAHGFVPRRIWQVPLGLPSPAARPDRAPRIGTQLRLVCLGLVTPTKGTDLVITAMALAGWEGLRLDVHGIVCDQGYLERLQALCPPDRVHWHGGYLPADLPDILAGADAVVMPSRSENTPLVVMESQSAGVPVIGSGVGGIPEMLGQGRWGLIFVNGDAEDLSRQLVRLRDEPDLLDGLRRNIPRQRRLDDEMVDLEAIYRECLQAASPTRAPGSVRPDWS